MNRHIRSLSVLTLVLATMLIAGTARADDHDARIKALPFPIAELGGCTDASSCETYCNDSAHMAACLEYAEKKGLMSKQELHLAKKVAEKVSEGKTPGGCRTSQECEAYCSGKVENIEACVAFGEELGVIPDEELAQAKQIIRALKSGAHLPGGCKSKDACEEYCKEDSHLSECISFAEKAGFVTKEEAEMAHKSGGKGPGGCRGKEACEAYCDDDAHAEECVKFALDKDLLSEEQKEQVQGGVQKIKDGLDKVPTDARADVESCLRRSISNYDAVMAGNGALTKKSGEKVGECFERTMSGYAEKMKRKYTQQAGAPGRDPEADSEDREHETEGVPPSGYMPKGIPSNIPSGMMPPGGIPAGFSPNDIPAGMMLPQ